MSRTCTYSKLYGTIFYSKGWNDMLFFSFVASCATVNNNLQLCQFNRNSTSKKTLKLTITDCIVFPGNIWTQRFIWRFLRHINYPIKAMTTERCPINVFPGSLEHHHKTFLQGKEDNCNLIFCALMIGARSGKETVNRAPQSVFLTTATVVSLY